jgi:hypothetical protein
LQFAVLTEGFVVASEHIFSFLLEKKRDDWQCHGFERGIMFFCL